MNAELLISKQGNTNHRDENKTAELRIETQDLTFTVLVIISLSILPIATGATAFAVDMQVFPMGVCYLF